MRRLEKMAVTKTIVKRRCPATGKSIHISTVFFHGIMKIEEKKFSNKIKKIIKKICPDPNGTVLFKEFYNILMIDFPKHKFEKNQLKSIRKYVKSLLETTITELEKEEEEEEVLFIKETTCEERNRIGFQNAIVIQ